MSLLTSRPITLTMPDGAVEEWDYSAEGDEMAYTNPLGQTVLYGRDDAGRQTSVDYPVGTPDATFSHDDDDRRTGMVDGTGATTWAYDAAGRLTGLTTPQATLTYGYDDAGRRTSMTQAGVGTTTYAHNDAGQTTSLTNPQAQTTTWTYDNAGRELRKTFSTGGTSSGRTTPGAAF